MRGLASVQGSHCLRQQRLAATDHFMGREKLEKNHNNVKFLNFYPFSDEPSKKINLKKVMPTKTPALI